MDIPDGLQLTPFDETFNQDPYAVYARLRHLAPVNKESASLYRESWTISQYAQVDRLLRDERLSVDPRTVGLRRDPRAENAVTQRDPDMMNLDGPDHHRLRALVQKAFTPTAVKKFAPRIRAIVEGCLDAITTPIFDVVKEYAKPVPTIVIAEFIGVDSRDHAQFKAWTDDLLMQGYPMPTEEQWARIVAADRSLRECMSHVVEERCTNPTEDLISHLVAAEEKDDRLTNDEIVAMCCLLIGAGNFTTTDLISNSIFHCLNLYDTQNGFPCTPEEIIEECLRFDSPVLAARRFVTEEVDIDGHILPEGCTVNLLFGAANHDPDKFSNPDELRIDVTSKANLSFGRGIHNCLGAPLARLEAAIALDCFFTRFPQARFESARHRKQMDFRGFSTLIVNSGG